MIYNMGITKLTIFLIIIFYGFFVIINTPKNEKVNYIKAIKNTPKISAEPLNITVPESLKTNFKKGIDYCKTQNIAQNGAFENCVLYYIYERKKTDHEIILKINTYCANITTNECDRRNCVEKFMYN